MPFADPRVPVERLNCVTAPGNVAVTVVAAVTVTLHDPVPVHPPPLQPPKVEPAAGVAVSVTAVPLAKPRNELFDSAPARFAHNVGDEKKLHERHGSRTPEI